MSRTYIIAEAGVNHNGSLEMAKQLIDIAAEAKADAVKFQTFKAEGLVSRSSPKAEYQLQTTDEKESQFDMLKKLELTYEMHHGLISYCQQKGIDFLSTPFESKSLLFLVQELNLPVIKISSGEITNAPFLLEIARTGKKIILSTGMSTLEEVRQALSVLAYGFINASGEPSAKNFEEAYVSQEGKKILRENVILLHCTTEYPAPFEDVNLRAMDTMYNTFGIPVGLSDHTSGIAISIAAVARGAAIIEKHITLNKHLPGPDHQASLEPDELKRLVKSIRQVEQALGTGEKIPSPVEEKNKLVARKSLVAACPIQKGELFTENNVVIKRPGTGLSPFKYWEIVGNKSANNFQKGEVLKNDE